MPSSVKGIFIARRWALTSSRPLQMQADDFFREKLAVSVESSIGVLYGSFGPPGKLGRIRYRTRTLCNVRAELEVLDSSVCSFAAAPARQCSSDRLCLR